MTGLYLAAGLVVVAAVLAGVAGLAAGSCAFAAALNCCLRSFTVASAVIRSFVLVIRLPIQTTRIDSLSFAEPWSRLRINEHKTFEDNKRAIHSEAINSKSTSQP